jgi:hypothetical protein
MSEHLLITFAKRRPYRQVPALPDGASYDQAKGYWLKSGLPLVESMGGQVTKKCDQETGEDQKGE